MFDETSDEVGRVVGARHLSDLGGDLLCDLPVGGFVEHGAYRVSEPLWGDVGAR